MVELDNKPIWSATPTPFLKDGSLDDEGVVNLVEQHERLGVTTLLLAGTTGEGPYTPDLQLAEFVRLVKRVAEGRFHIAVQISDASAARVRVNMRRMQDSGADSLVIAAPVPTVFATPEFLRRYFLESVEEATLPMGLYIVRPPLAPPMSLNFWCELASHPKVKYVKDSTSFEDFQHALLEVKSQRPELVLNTGNEFNVVYAVDTGYDGALAGTGILIGGLLRRALAALAAGNKDEANAWQKLSNECLWGIFGRDRSRWLGGLKYALKYLGVFRSDFMQLDYVLTDDDRREIEATCDGHREFILPHATS